MATEFDLCQSTHSLRADHRPGRPDRLLRDRRADPGRDPGPVRPADRRAAAAAEVGVRHLDLVRVLRGHPGAGAGAGAHDPRARASRATCCTWTATGRSPGTGPICSWDAATFPDPAAMLAELTGMGFRVSLVDQLVRQPAQPRTSPPARTRGYFLRRRRRLDLRGRRVARVRNRPAASSTSPTRRRPPGSRTSCDRCCARAWPCSRRTSPRACRRTRWPANGMVGTELHNVYSLLFNDVVAAVTARGRPGTRMVWARSSFLGGQRHSAQWGGDTNCSYPAMGSTLRGGLSHGAVRGAVLEPRRRRVHRHADARPVRAVGPVRRAVPAGAVPRHDQPAAVGLPRRRRAGRGRGGPAALPAHAVPVLGRGRPRPVPAYR